MNLKQPCNIISLGVPKDRLSRCAQSCQDKIQDKVSINTTQSEAGKLQEEMNVCVDQCCDTHRELLPRMFERMSETLLQLQGASST
jgi:small-conductance mechanosensitive channel